MKVLEVQNITNSGITKEAVKRLEVDVGREFGEGFFNSCKDVKFGATNGYAMDLLGGGAKNYLAFLRYMGMERSLGSPFQIDFPGTSTTNLTSNVLTSPSTTLFDNSTSSFPFNDSPLICSSPELNARCACPDCPSVCANLPHIDSPSEIASRVCKVGKMSCFSFSLVIIYAILLVGFTLGLGLKEVIGRSGKKAASSSGNGEGRTSWTTLRRRLSWRGGASNGYDRVPLEDNEYEDSVSPTTARNNSTQRSSASNSLIGATSTNFDSTADDNRRSGYSPANSLNRNRNSRGASLLDPSGSETSSNNNPYLQPRTYALNTYLTSTFYKLGLFCATRPYLTLSLGLLGCGIFNLGWNNFDVEKDPVKLWVSRGSESELAKNTFDEAFGPFYRTEQIFVSVAPRTSSSSSSLSTRGVAKWEPVDKPVLNWENLQWWASVELSIRNLKSTPNNYTLKDVCFSPQTDPLPPLDSSACVVQSLMGYFGDSLESISEDSWSETLNSCATTPAACLPGSGMPMNPKLVLGGIPKSEGEGETGDQVELRASEARALVITYVVKNSLDLEVVAKAEEWEATLQAFLVDLAAPTSKARSELGLELAYSTGLSLEEELNESTNTDIPIVALSYIVMFLYVSINLGSSGAGLLRSLGRTLVILGGAIVTLLGRIPVPGRGNLGGRGRSGSITSLTGSSNEIGAYFRRQLLVDSKFLLG